MNVIQLDPTDGAHVKQFREIRLRALQTDPTAFGSDYERELAFNDDAWQGRLAGFAGHPGAVFAAVSTATPTGTDEPAGAPVGIVGVGMPERTDAAIWGMWVAPEGRRRGVAAQLLDTAESWAVQSGAQTATLWVHRANDRAQALYKSRDYELIGPDDPVAHVPVSCADEVCLRARLSST
jgi:ribosomal protein S18 acetylase RimI-like enzyme